MNDVLFPHGEMGDGCIQVFRSSARLFLRKTIGRSVGLDPRALVIDHYFLQSVTSGGLKTHIFRPVILTLFCSYVQMHDMWYIRWLCHLRELRERMSRRTRGQVCEA